MDKLGSIREGISEMVGRPDFPRSTIDAAHSAPDIPGAPWVDLHLQADMPDDGGMGGFPPTGWTEDLVPDFRHACVRQFHVVTFRGSMQSTSKSGAYRHRTRISTPSGKSIYRFLTPHSTFSGRTPISLSKLVSNVSSTIPGDTEWTA